MKTVVKDSENDFATTSASHGRIQTSPEVSPIIYRDLRRKLVERFPYAILYRLYPGLVYVVAIMHAKQNPAIWKRRASGGEPG